MSLKLAPAAAVDGRLIWRWRNEAQARRSSPDPARIPLARHLEWFDRKLQAADCAILIAKDAKGRPVGQVRLDLGQGGVATVSITVDKAARGRGVGTEILQSIPAKVKGRRVRRLIAFVKPDNLASVLAFLRAGFRFRRLEAAMYRLER